MAKRLEIKKDQLSIPSTHLGVYNNSKRLVLGTIILSIKVGHVEINVKFQVMDIPATYNILLGRARLHDH